VGVDSRERVEAALAGAEVDRPPAGAWGHRYRDEWSPERLADVTVARASLFGWDFVKFQPRATFFAEAFGAHYRPAGHSLRAPVIDRAPLRDVSDWSRLELVAPQVMEDQARALGLVVSGLGKRVPVLQTVFSPLSVASYLVGRDNRRLVRDMRSSPDVVLPALGRIADALIDFSRRSVEAGAAGVFYAISGFATRSAMPASVYDELALPTDRRILDALPADAWFNVLHVCGSRVNLQVASALPVQAVSWSIHNQGNPGLAEGRLLTGRAVMGGLEQRGVLLGGTQEAIAEQVRAAVAATGGRGLLIAPGCSVPPRAPDANLRAMMEAVAA
jgi:uroporphyrinogen decarboxylase